MDATSAAAAALGSSSNQSSSSTSSGYGSATTTPTTPLCSSYETQSTPATTATPVAEPAVPVATVAAVAPFYNEAITATDTQRQHYYQSYAYPEMAHTTPQYSPYDSFIGGMVTAGSGHYSGNYQVDASIGNRHASLTAVSSASSNSLIEKRSSLPYVVATPNNGSNNIFKDAAGKKTSESTGATLKPQAAATPFYAQPPLHATKTEVGAYYDPYKCKMPTKLPTPTGEYHYDGGYGNHYAAAAGAATTSYQQQQQYYAAAKFQLQDASYTATVKPLPTINNVRQYPNSYYGAAGSSAPTYYDKYEKYMYTPTATAFAGVPPLNSAVYSAPHPSHYPAPDASVDSYRKTATSWHWNMDYPISNCRSLPPPPPNSLPTAAVLPTNATYLPQAASSHDAFLSKYDKYSPPAYYQQYMSTGAAGGTRNAWSGSHAHHLQSIGVPERLTHAHSRAPPHPPPPTYPHAVTQHFHSPTAATSVRQSCCSQPAYQQQSCYYPRTSPNHMSNSYPPQSVHPQPTSFSPTGGNSSISKYGGNIPADYTHKSKAIKPSNDLYVAATYDPLPATHLNFSYGTTSQRYTTTANAMSSAPTHQVVNRNTALDSTAPYYNDLNLQAAFENYATSVQQSAQYHQHQHQHQHSQEQQQHVTDATRTQHLTYHRLSSSNQTKSPLLDFRKSSIQNTDYYLTQQPIANLEDHVVSNSSYSDFNISNNVNTTATDYSSGSSGMESAEKSPGAAKNLSLRDFLTTWNEDEEDFSTANELNFVGNESQLAEHSATLAQVAEITHMSLNANNSSSAPTYLHESVASSAQPPYKHVAPTPQQQPPPKVKQQIIENHLQFKGSFNTRPKIHVGITVDSTVEMETNQYINLPDIIIDIEKASNVATTAPEPKDISFSNFDVEKELDELQSKKVATLPTAEPRPIGIAQQRNMEKQSLATQRNGNMQHTNNNNTATVQEFSKEINRVTHNNDEKSLHATSKFNESFTDNAGDAFVNVQSERETSFDNPEEFLKDIDEYENNHSNESTFEKEYETFINKIDHDVNKETPKDAEQGNSENITPSKVEDLSFKMKPEKQSSSKDIENNSKELGNISEEFKPNNPLLCQESKETALLDETEYVKNVNNFSKFHKRKRKLMEANNSEEDRDIVTTKSKKTKLEHNLITKHKESVNFPEIYTKKCRKRSSQLHKKAIKFDTNSMENSENKNVGKYKSTSNSLAVYYKIMRSLRRFWFRKLKPDTSVLVQQHIAKLRERRLPLIKRQSAKKYASDRHAHFNPKSLKGLSVSFINTEVFRNNILKDIHKLGKNANLSLDEPQLHATDNEVGHKQSGDTKTKTPEADDDMNSSKRLACSEVESTIVNEFNEASVYEKGTKFKTLSDAEGTTEDFVVEQFGESVDLKPVETNEPTESSKKNFESESESESESDNLEEEYSDERSNKFLRNQLNTEIERAGLHCFEKLNESEVNKEVYKICKDEEREQELGVECERKHSQHNKVIVAVDDDSNATSNSSHTDSESESNDSSSSSSTNSTTSDDDTRSTCSSDDDCTSSDGGEVRDLNEMEALEKELTLTQASGDGIGDGEFPQHFTNANVKKTDEIFADKETNKTNHINNNNKKTESLNFDKTITNHDIVDLKRILESDSEENNDNQQHTRLGEVESSAKTTDTNTLSNGLKSVAETRPASEELEQDKITDIADELPKEPKDDSMSGNRDPVEVTVLQTTAAIDISEEGTSSSTVSIDVPATTTCVSDLVVGLPVSSNSVSVDVLEDVAVDVTNSITIPKLSDLCEIALRTNISQCNGLTVNNSNHNNNDDDNNISKPTASATKSTATTKIPIITTEDTLMEQRELSVEEALAEMYRQAGVTSDPEDYEMDEGKDAQDVLLINLEEILDSDSDVYVLQCDMNENILGVVTHTTESVTGGNAERVESTLQLVEILNSNEINRDENDMQIINTSGHVIVLNETEHSAATALNTATNEQATQTQTQTPKLQKAEDIDTTIANVDIDNIDNIDTIDTNNIDIDDGLTASQFDMPIPTIHHEEIVPENYKTFEKEKFIKYLHAKYVQKNISKFYHANNILKKYKRRLTKKQKIE